MVAVTSLAVKYQVDGLDFEYVLAGCFESRVLTASLAGNTLMDLELVAIPVALRIPQTSSYSFKNFVVTP